eukprot:scaffold5055_cov92-Skeletonema_dohrnii-CCMP3373.AAC.4
MAPRQEMMELCQSKARSQHGGRKFKCHDVIRCHRKRKEGSPLHLEPTPQSVQRKVREIINV